MSKRKRNSRSARFKRGDTVEVVDGLWGCTAEVVSAGRGMVTVTSPFLGGTVVVPESKVRAW